MQPMSGMRRERGLLGAYYMAAHPLRPLQTTRAIGLDLDDRFDHEYALNVFFRSDQFPFVLHFVADPPGN